eukprot:TRINITY_DN61273_c0_g1_i1.p1 TRINITY_DN61273_c0_g1~~TRINITY_DN61273_c0_g1_i1.p1  ORF type:complete len:640 (-),score=97.82 TRINITY_DN61273_c0_g1_i1:193-2112(-)
MGKKGKKLNKKQLEEQLGKAAEDQVWLEKKERLCKLEQDALAEHQKRLEWELDSKQRVEEAERLEEENAIVNMMKGERQENLEYEQQKLADQTSWQKFISCTSRPNVSFENEITTYMTMVRDEKVQKIEDAMKKCQRSEEIVGDLMESYCKHRESGDISSQEWCLYYIQKIRELEIEQIDEATAFLLQYIEKQEANHAQVQLSWGQDSDGIKIGFWANLLSKGFRPRTIDFQKVQLIVDLPKAIGIQTMGHTISVRALYTTYDDAGHRPALSQLSVGGMIRVDLLSIPPASRRVKGWTIRQIPSPGQELTRLPYPNNEHAAASTAVAPQSCKVEYKVPDHVIVRKSPTISWWDTTAENWSTEGITEVTWEPSERKISFYSARLASFSITQERHMELPYQWWCIRPLAPLVAQLTLRAARYELIFVISEDGLRLRGPELPELRELMYDGEGLERTPRVRSPATLLCELRDSGLNLMPEDADAEYLDGYTPKNIATQHRAYSDLSELAAYWDIASSRHNKSLPRDRFGPGSDRAIVRIRENLLQEEYDCLDPDCDIDYQAIMFFPDKACFVQSLELKSPCNETPVEGNLTHASLFLCFENRPDPGPNHEELLERLQVTCASARFVEAVRQTMMLMKLLSFT